MRKVAAWMKIFEIGFGLSALATEKFKDRFLSEMDFANAHPDEAMLNDNFTLFFAKSRAKLIDLPRLPKKAEPIKLDGMEAQN